MSSPEQPPEQPLIPIDGNGDPIPPEPEIFSISPIAASLAGGVDITIRGTGFQLGADVFFGSTSSPTVTFVNSTTVRAVLPPGSQTGSVTVTLVNPNGTSASLPGGFTYITTQQSDRAEVLGITPLTVIEDTQTEVTVRGRNLITAFNEGLVALRGPTRVAVSIANVVTELDNATGIESLKFTVRITASPALEPLERMAIQVLASRRPGAQSDGVVESSTKMFTVLPRARPVPIAFTPTLDPDRPTLVVVAGRNLEGCTLELSEGATVHVQKSDERSVMGLVSLEGVTSSSTSKQLLLRSSSGSEVAQYQVSIAPPPEQTSSGGGEALMASPTLELTLAPVPDQQVVGPTAQDSKLFSLNGQINSAFFFDWTNFEITIFETTLIITIINEVFLIPFFDGGGPELDTPVLAQVGKLFRVRGAALLVALRVHLIVHIQIVLIIGFRFNIWPFGVFNEFFDLHPWAIGSVVIGIRIEINITFSIHFLLAFVRPDGRLNVLFTFNLTIGFDFTLSNDGLRLRFDPDFEYSVLPGGVRPLLNLFPCNGRFQLASENGNTVFHDSLGGSQSFYFARTAGECCVPWEFDLTLVRFAPGRPTETVQESFQADFCLVSALNPNLMDVVIVSDRTPNGFPPPLDLEVAETATLKALARPVDEAGNPIPGPMRDLHQLGFTVQFFLEQAVAVLDPTTLPGGSAFAILEGSNIIRVTAVPPPRVIDVETGEEVPMGFLPGAVLGFRIADLLAQGLPPGLNMGGLPVNVFPQAPIAVEAMLAIENAQGQLTKATTIERYEPFEPSQNQYVLAVKVTVPQIGPLPSTLTLTVDDVQLGQAPLSGLGFASGRGTVTDPTKFFEGDLSIKTRQASIPLSRPMPTNFIKVPGLTIKANQTEAGPAGGIPTRLVPPGNAVANRDVVVTVSLRGATSSRNVQFTAGQTLSLPVVNEETFEEYPRYFLEVQDIMSGSGTPITTLRNFAESSYTAMRQGLPQPPAPPQPPSDTLLNTQGELLWTTAFQAAQATTNRVLDDRPLYWARLRAIAGMRSFHRRNGLVVSADTIKKFERPSRGLNQQTGAIVFPANAGGFRRAILTGFDPFGLTDKPARSNPSGLLALVFNAKQMGASSAPVFVRTAVIPVRYRDFNDGFVEAAVRPNLGSIVMLMTTSENTGIEFYDVERFAVANRINIIDNENKLPGSPPTGPNFVESTLPYADVITSAETLPGPNGNAPFVIDQSYRTASAAQQRGVNRAVPNPPNQRVTAQAGQFRPEPLLDDTDQAAFIKKPDTPGAGAVEGSGGSYLSNEIFYRTAVVRNSDRPTLASGHFHVPSVDVHPSIRGLNLITGVTTAVNRFLEKLFRMTGSGDITFPRTAVNTTSAPITFTATNITNQTINASSVDVPAPFEVTWPGPTPIPISPNSTLSLPFKFKPTAPGLQTANARLFDKDGEVLLITKLTGEGVAVFAIQGQIIVGGQPRQGVQVALSGSRTTTATTGTDGRYSFTGLDAGGNYLVTPSLANHTFSPTSLPFNALAADQTGNFTGTLNRHSISGRVVNIQQISHQGVTMTLSGPQSANTTTNSQGQYSFVDVAAGDNYIVAPSLSGFTFNPPNRAINNLSADVSGVDFTSEVVVAGRANFALESNGSVANASSTLDLGRLPRAAINGDRRGLHWGTGPTTGSGWHDATPDAFPDWLEIAFNGQKTISEVHVFTIQDDFNNPVEPNEAMTFSSLGIQDFDVEHWTGTAWQLVPGGAIVNNNKVWRRIAFAPLTTSKIRVVVKRALNSHSRIVEVEAWQSAPLANHALETNGSIATASSAFSLASAARFAINGDRRGPNHWKDSSHDAFPDWLEIAFAGPRTIHEINVFSVQDNAIAPELPPPGPEPPVIPPVEPTEQTTFTQFGVQDFDLEYWIGSMWQLVPGGAIVNNNKVWRKVSFPPLTTTKIRVLVKRGVAGFSRIVEVEAWG